MPKTSTRPPRSSRSSSRRSSVPPGVDPRTRGPTTSRPPHTREDWRAKRASVDAILDDTGGVVTRVGDETVGEIGEWNNEVLSDYAVAAFIRATLHRYSIFPYVQRYARFADLTPGTG